MQLPNIHDKKKKWGKSRDNVKQQGVKSGWKWEGFLYDKHVFLLLVGLISVLFLKKALCDLGLHMRVD